MPAPIPAPVRALRALACVLLLAGAATAVGCQESGFDERKETSKPLKVQHELGETKVPGQATRPLTLTADTLDDTLALRVRPAAAALPGARMPRYLARAARGVEAMPAVEAAHLQALREVDPDLILGRATAQGRLYDELSKIAPTVMTASGGGQWKLNVRLVGEALGRTNDAEQLLTDYDARVARVRRAAGTRPATGTGRLPRDAPRVAVASLTAHGVRYAPRDSFAGTILSDAGVRQVRSARTAELTLLAGGRAGAASRTREIAGRRIETVDGRLWWGPGGTLAARAALRDLRSALAG